MKISALIATAFVLFSTNMAAASCNGDPDCMTTDSGTCVCFVVLGGVGIY
ncbi:MAG: hypothetical protein AAF919_16160 [Pseudomonadota bacterium]